MAKKRQRSGKGSAVKESSTTTRNDDPKKVVRWRRRQLLSFVGSILVAVVAGLLHKTYNMERNKKKSGSLETRKDTKVDQRQAQHFLSCFREQPSLIHGMGVFATGPFNKCGFEIQSEEKLKYQVYGATMNLNSPLVPPWRKLLLGSNTDGNALTTLDAARISTLKNDWIEYVNEEQAKATIYIAADLDYNDGLRLKSVEVEVKEDLSEGEEAFRAYGDEWLAIKYYHLRANLNRKPKEGLFTFFVDMNLLQIQSFFSENSEPTSLQDVPQELLPHLEGSDIVAVSLPVLTFFEKCLGILALDKFNKGNRMFDITWSSNLEKLKSSN